MQTILKIAVAVPLRAVFDYLPPEGVPLKELKPGQRIAIPFGPQIKTGFLLAIENTTEIDPGRLKNAISVLDKEPLQSQSDLKLVLWASRYYHHPIGEVVSTAYPILLRKGKAAKTTFEKRLYLSAPIEKTLTQVSNRAHRQKILINLLSAHPEGMSESQLNELDWNWRSVSRNLLKRNLIEAKERNQHSLPTANNVQPDFNLNAEQQIAVDAIHRKLNGFRVFLLEGITGSGKTEVYFRVIQSVLRMEKQVMVLVPEITLTPQLEARFRDRFNSPIAVFHSGLSEEKRKNTWLQTARGQTTILLGTRSAVFTPMKSPGLIILDEEHDISFKQREGFRFSARDVAVKRAQFLNIPVILGSATPSLESVHNANNGRYQHLVLPSRAGEAIPPSVKLLDIRKQQLAGGLAPRLIEAIKKKLAQQEQVLLFINRRGYAPTLICHDCGWVARCQRCDSNLVIHAKQKKLRCHHCLHERRLPKICEHCQSEQILSLGLGTERVEQILTKIFPAASIVRIDRDSTRRKGSLNNAINDISSGKTDILVGTQMLAKGHHFPNVTLVGILDTDSGLFSTDFRATERLSQLIVQVSGRAGREKKSGTVVIQTRHPEHPLLNSLIDRGYPGFAKDALKERQRIGLPPFNFQALFRAESTDPHHPFNFLDNIRKTTEISNFPEIDILGPVPAPMTKRIGRYRFQLLIQAKRRKTLHSHLDKILPTLTNFSEFRKIKWSIDIDPVDLF